MNRPAYVRQWECDKSLNEENQVQSEKQVVNVTRKRKQTTLQLLTPIKKVEVAYGFLDAATSSTAKLVKNMKRQVKIEEKLLTKTEKTRKSYQKLTQTPGADCRLKLFHLCCQMLGARTSLLRL